MTSRTFILECDRRHRHKRGVETAMKVGVPKEVKNHEYRVAITPVGVHELTAHGHQVCAASK